MMNFCGRKVSQITYYPIEKTCVINCLLCSVVYAIGEYVGKHFVNHTVKTT